MSITMMLFSLIVLGQDYPVQSDQAVTFFPTYGYLSPDGQVWNVRIHGWLYEPEEKSLKRRFALGLFRRVLGLSEHSSQSERFKERARWFLVDAEDEERISVQVGDKIEITGRTEDKGHFKATVAIRVSQIADVEKEPNDGGRWLTVRAVVKPEDSRCFSGRVMLIGPEGTSVISDIDDTIKITDVRNRKTLIANTFFNEFKAVDGMSEVYRRWAREGKVFHYDSGSPWPLYPPLAFFLKSAGFPWGTFHLRIFDWFESKNFELSPPEKMKTEIIEQIMTDFPRRKFIFVGDTTEKDPEIYGSFAKKYPDRVVHIYIRNATDESRESERFKAIFSAWPRSKWTLFKAAGEILKPAEGERRKADRQ